MLKLVKQTSYENYPITPQTSAVRRMSVRGSSSSVVDLNASYLVVKNQLTTTVNGAAVARNVGFGCYFSQGQIWEYPTSVQIRNASLKIGGQVVEYCEDVNVRIANMAVYEKNHEQMRRDATVGGYTFQRLEAGPKSASPAVAGTPIRNQGQYLSAFLNETLDATSRQKTGCAYKEVSCVIPLREVFKFCESPQASQLFVGGTATQEIIVEIQFEDSKQILCEYLNYPTDLETVAGTPRPLAGQTLSLDPASIANTDGTQPATVGADLTKVFRINTTNEYEHVSQVPLCVGQPICTWLTGALPAVVGSNYSVITQITVPDAGGVATIYFKAYTLGGQFLRAGGAQITAAQYFANLYAGGNGVAVALSCVNDPVLAAGQNSVLTATDAGLNTTYQVNGMELVMVERPMAKGSKQSIQYINWIRDTDTIPTGQLTYSKSFQLDPMCAGVFAVFPPKRTAGSAQTNLLSLSNHAAITTGLTYRNLIDNQQLYSRDITFSAASDAVEPLWVERLSLTAQQLGWPLKNLSPNATMMAKNGVCTHAIIAEPVEVKQVPQQLNLRMTFNTNTSDRTIYVWKAIMSQVTI